MTLLDAAPNTTADLALTERDRFVLGLMWRPGPDFNSWADPCPCGNDGVCCDLIDGDA